MRLNMLLGGCDQVLLAVAHLILGIIVARLGGVAALGQFAFSYAILVMGHMLHGAVVGEVYSISSHSRSAEDDFGASYILVTTLPLSLTFLIVTQMTGLSDSVPSQVSTIWFATAVIGSMFFWTTRVYLYRRKLPYSAFLSTLIYAVVMVGLSYRLFYTQGAQASPFAGIAIGSLLAMSPLIPEIRFHRIPLTLITSFLAESVKYGRWAVPAAGLIWLTNNGYFLIMPMGAGLSETAGLRALLNMLLPFNVVIVGSSFALLPIWTEYAQASGTVYLGGVVNKIAIAVAVGGTAFAVGVWLLGGWLMVTIYGEAFGEFADGMGFAACLPLLWGISTVYRTGLRALGQASDIFYVYLIAMMPAGLGLMIYLSQIGSTASLIGIAITQLIIAVIMVQKFNNAKRRQRYEV